MKKLFISISILLSVFAAKAQENKLIKVLDVQTFKDSVTTKKVQLIDVRTPEEYNSGHIENAQNIDFYAIDFNTQFNKLNKEHPVYIYCRSGNRSRQAANKLSAMGFTQIFDLTGGFLAWPNK